LAIYCYDQYHEKVSIQRVRELRIKIKNETLAMGKTSQSLSHDSYQPYPYALYAKT
jgi:hypothetical protein